MSDKWDVKGRQELNPVTGVNNLVGKLFGLRESIYTVQNTETGEYCAVDVTTDGSTEADIKAVGEEISKGNIRPI